MKEEKQNEKWCIQSRIRDSLFNALQRVIGTAIGAVFGTVFILITLYINDFGYGPVHYLLLSAFIIPVIYLTVLIHEVNNKLYGRTRHYIRRVLFIWRKL